MADVPSSSDIPYAGLPEPERKRLLQDEETVRTMTKMYCRAHHADAAEEDGLVPSCRACAEYAIARTRACPKQHKGNCDDCEIRCYNPAMREQIRQIMAYAGPRMMFTHPVMAVRHLRKKLAR